MDDFEQDKDDGNEMSMGMQFPIMEPGITPKYIILSLEKLHNFARFTDAQGDRQQAGANYVTPPGKYIDVAFVRPGRESVEEALPDDVILFDELVAIRKQMIEAENELRKIAQQKGDF